MEAYVYVLIYAAWDDSYDDGGYTEEFVGAFSTIRKAEQEIFTCSPEESWDIEHDATNGEIVYYNKDNDDSRGKTYTLKHVQIQ